MRSSLLSIATALVVASPAAAQWCDCERDVPLDVVMPSREASGFVDGSAVRYARRTVLVGETRFVPRIVYVPRVRLVRRTVSIPQPRYGGQGYPAGYRYGDATFVPPGISYPCLMGTVGCDSSAVGPLGF